MNAEICPANAETWFAFEKFAAAVTAGVRYGPGRGIWENGRFVVTYAPGRRSRDGDLRLWPNVASKLYPSLHCTSLTNVGLAWLLRRNEDFTHAGNVPDLDKLLTAGPEPHVQPGVGTWRGYGDACFEIPSNGSTKARVRSLIRGQAYIDAVELYERRASMPTFVVFAQSTKKPGGWNWWHHTGFFVFRESRMYRFAADGYKGAPRGYSASPVRWTEVTPANISALDLCRYRVWGVDTADGSYGDQSRPIAEIGFE